MTAEGPEVDWYADPAGSGGERWWDGQAWTTRLKPSPQADTAQNRSASSSRANFGELPADWYPDPGGSGGERWWDGQVWTTRMKPIPNEDIKTSRPSTPSTAPEQIEPITADWYDDPDGSGGERYWDGERWTKQCRSKTETLDACGSQSVPPPNSRAEPPPYAQIRPPAARNPGNTAQAHYPPISAPMPFWKRSDPVRVVAAAMGVALVVVVGVVLVTQLFDTPTLGRAATTQVARIRRQLRRSLTMAVRPQRGCARTSSPWREPAATPATSMGRISLAAAEKASKMPSRL
jgi:hypothetical protein